MESRSAVAVERIPNCPGVFVLTSGIVATFLIHKTETDLPPTISKTRY